jgi:RIP metalloprotease RseP
VPQFVEEKGGRKIPRIGVELNMRLAVKRVAAGSPAALAGIAPDDLITSLKRMSDGRVEASWQRGGSPMGPAVMRQIPECADGLSIRMEGEILYAAQSRPLFGAVAAAAKETVSIMGDTLKMLCFIVTRRIGSGGVSGPVAIVRLTYTATEPGFGYYLWFVALLSANLAVINMLPVPVLDGGHIVFILAEKLRGRPLPRRERPSFSTASAW